MENNSQTIRSSFLKTFHSSILLFTILTFLFMFSKNVNSSDKKEPYIHAAFLYNVHKYVIWPHRLPSNPIKPIRYCVLGTNTIDQLLEGTISERNTKDKAVSFTRISALVDIDDCDLLYISVGNGIPVREIFRKLEGKAIITASNIEKFAERGGMVHLSQKNKRIHVIINMDVVKESDLKISSKLKKLSTIISK